MEYFTSLHIVMHKSFLFKLLCYTDKGKLLHMKRKLRNFAVQRFKIFTKIETPKRPTKANLRCNVDAFYKKENCTA